MEMFYSERRLQYFAVETAEDLRPFTEDDDGVIAAIQYLIDEAAASAEEVDIPEESQYIDCLDTVQKNLQDITDTLENSSRMKKSEILERLRGLIAEIDEMT